MRPSPRQPAVVEVRQVRCKAPDPVAMVLPTHAGSLAQGTECVIRLMSEGGQVEPPVAGLVSGAGIEPATS